MQGMTVFSDELDAVYPVICGRQGKAARNEKAFALSEGAEIYEKQKRKVDCHEKVRIRRKTIS